MYFNSRIQELYKFVNSSFIKKDRIIINLKFPKNSSSHHMLQHGYQRIIGGIARFVARLARVPPSGDYLNITLTTCPLLSVQKKASRLFSARWIFWLV